MHEDLRPRYDHRETEEKIYKLWEESGYFNPDNLGKEQRANGKWHKKTRAKHAKKLSAIRHKPFAIIMPPPNANGALHMGHAFEATLQDLMIRFWRMRGRKTLWLPGADHAGFETQVVFDKKLEKEGRGRFAMGREEVWKEIWDFTQKNKKVMEGQFRKLGVSCDWSREKFTLDPDIVKIVYETFEKLYKDGLVYRDLKIVNWCPKHKTALSDLEVKYVERKDQLYYIKYGPLTLATVRPETKFGDTALAVNPKDKRYKNYVGKEIEAQGILGVLKFKVVADEAVDPKFGAGVVKVTPAHDQTDFEIWQRHKNEIPGPKIIIDESGRLTGEIGEFKGMKVAEAREKVAEKMKEIGILERLDPDYIHQVATCYKCGTTLEPLPKMQWFVKMKPLAEKAIRVVQQKKIKFYPERSKKVYFHWLKNIRDWNVSRQIVWGIRIPAWFCLGCGETKINPEIKARWFFVRHGETDWNKEGRSMGQRDIPLNEKGKEQAQRVAKNLKGQKIDLIISSDLARARETAEIIAEETGAELVIESDFKERSHGLAEGLSKEEWIKRYPLLREYYDKSANQENYEELEKRVWQAFSRHFKNHKHKNVVIVSHAGSLRTLVKHLKNWEVSRWASFRIENSELIQADVLDSCKRCGGHLYEQDPDVFDTWFSSGQWPFATLMTTRPKQKDFQEFYPTDVMAPGYEIIFFWVARMIMLGLYRTGKIPFRTVYLHGIVRDKDRQKMSKSKGNVIDPLGVIDLYGTDAVRMAFVVGTGIGSDPIISEEKIRGYRNFATKIWNISRFILMNKPKQMANGKWQMAEIDKKHLAELKKLKTEVAKHIEKFEFHLAAEKLYHYVWHTFADKIIEEYKPRLQKQSFSEDSLAAYHTLETILMECLKILHPFMPFITEEIYLKFNPEKILMIEKW